MDWRYVCYTRGALYASMEIRLHLKLCINNANSFKFVIIDVWAPACKVWHGMLPNNLFIGSSGNKQHSDYTIRSYRYYRIINNHRPPTAHAEIMDILRVGDSNLLFKLVMLL